MRSIVKITAVLLLAGTSVTAQESAWKAGVAAAAITPENPMWMAGYAARTRPSEGAIHDLHVKALALEHPSGRRMVFLTSDLISVPGPVRAQVVKQVTEKLRLPPECLMMNCSHTHCSTSTRPFAAASCTMVRPDLSCDNACAESACECRERAALNA